LVFDVCVSSRGPPAVGLGATENVRVENAIQSNMQGRKMRDYCR